MTEAQAIFEGRSYQNGNGSRSEAERGFSSLVSTENNRNNPHLRPTKRGKHCARFSLRGIDLRSGAGERVTRHIRVNCNCWDCSYCGPRKAHLYREYIRVIAQERGLNRFLTLTLDPKKFKFAPCACQDDIRRHVVKSTGEILEWSTRDKVRERVRKNGICTCKREQVKYLREVFAKFRVYAKRKFGESITYICVLEMHPKSGRPHLHLLVDRFIEQRWLSRTWDSIGGGHRVDIRWRSPRSIAKYLSKYLTKDLLLSAPKRSRRVTTARTVRLIPRRVGPKHFVWTLRKRSIWQAYDMEVHFGQQSLLSGYIASINYDDEGFLSGFDVSESPGEIAVQNHMSGA